MSLNRCFDCRFWDGPREVDGDGDPLYSHSHGDCKRHAPMVRLVITSWDRTAYDTENRPQWPHTGPLNGCGDFEQRAAETTPETRP